MRKPRVTIYGGDERNERLEWPNHLDVQLYPYKSQRAVARLQESLSTGSIDHLVVLTSYVGHGHAAGFKDSNVHTIRWPRSPGQLSRELGQMIPAEPIQNPLLVPTKPDHPGTGGGRGPLTTKEALMAEAEKPIVPMFEHVVLSPPRPDETFGRALTRILRAESMSQTDLARMIGKDTSTINGWIKDRGLPKDMGPLVDLWPELGRFDKTRTYKVAPTAAEAEVRAADDMKQQIHRQLVEGVKEKIRAAALPIVEPQLPPAAAPGGVITPELATTMTRWRKLKEELETTERYLFMLLREAGL